jgi:diacylglycerol kinase (ATP)
MAQVLDKKAKVKVKDMETQSQPTAPIMGQSAYASGEAHDNIPTGTRVRVIVNPASGKKMGVITTNSAGVDEVRQILADNGIDADLVETEYPGHATELAKQAIKEKYDIIIACGGDGTVGEVANALIGSDVTMGILPVGSANNVARMMHVPFDLAEAGKLLRLGEIRQVDMGRCNGRYFLETAGVGLDAALFPILNKVDKGEYIHLFDALRTLIKFRPRSMTLVLDGRAIRARALMVLVANGPYWGYSVPLAPDAKVDDHKFDIVVFRNFSKTDFIRHVVAALWSRVHRKDGHEGLNYSHHPKVQTYTAKRVQILASRYRPLPVAADAQPRGHTPAWIEVVPGALRVITGPGEHVTTTPSEGTPRGEPPKHRLKDG